MTNTALGVLDHYHQLEQKGDLTRQKAQDRALQIIKSMTFGNERQDYFWINDFEPRMIMHPFRPDLEGRNLAGIQDPGLDNKSGSTPDDYGLRKLQARL
ncbi:MAG: cache domain-containing protein [Desulfonatronovibrio sp.]